MGSSLETENSISRFVISMLGNVKTASPMKINLWFHYEQGDLTIQNGGKQKKNLLALLFSTGTGWLCNNHLEKYEFVNGKDYPIYYGK